MKGIPGLIHRIRKGKALPTVCRKCGKELNDVVCSCGKWNHIRVRGAKVVQKDGNKWLIEYKSYPYFISRSSRINETLVCYAEKSGTGGDGRGRAWTHYRLGEEITREPNLTHKQAIEKLVWLIESKRVNPKSLDLPEWYLPGWIPKEARIDK